MRRRRDDGARRPSAGALGVSPESDSDDSPGSGDASEVDAPPKAEAWRRWRSRRGALRMLAVFGVLLVLLYAAPWIAARTFLRSWLEGRASAWLHGTLEIDSLSLSWFHPPSVEGLRVRDGHDALVLSAKRIECGRSLVQLLSDRRNLGTIVVQDATFHLAVDPTGTNLDGLFRSSGDAVELPSHLELVVENARVDLDDRVRSQRWTLQVIGKAVVARDAASPIDMHWTARVPRSAIPLDRRTGEPLAMADTEDAPGRVTLLGVFTAPQGGSAGAGVCTARLEAVPLGLADLLMARWGRVEHLDGELSGTMILTAHGLADWGDLASCGRWTAELDCSGRQLALSAPWLSQEQLRSERLVAKSRARWDEGLLQFESLNVSTEVGEATLVGAIDPNDLSWSGLLNQVGERRLTSSGHVDLARVAAMLPGTLRLHEDVRVTAGSLAWEVVAGPSPGTAGSSGGSGSLWQGRVETSDLRAVRDGKPLTWKNPATIRFRLRRDERPLVIEHLECVSEFLQFHAAGDMERLAARGRFDLARLAEQLRQFVDLGESRLSGAGSLELDWKRAPDRKFELSVTSEVDAFDLRIVEGVAWREPRLRAVMSASGLWESHQLERLDAARIQTQGADEWFVVRLLSPVADFRDGGTWSVAAEGAGKLDVWRTRLAPWIDLSAWNSQGRIALNTSLTVDRQSLRVGKTDVSLSDVVVARPGFDFRDPRIQLVTDGITWDDQWRRITTRSLEWRGTHLSLQAMDVLCKFVEERQAVPQLSGTLRVAGSMDQIGRWFPPVPRSAPLVPVGPTMEAGPTMAVGGAGSGPGVVSGPVGATAHDGPQNPWRLNGRVEGDVRFQYGAGRTAFQWTGLVHDFRAQYASYAPLEEKTVRLEGAGHYAHASQVLKLERAAIESVTLGGSASGEVAQQPRAVATLGGNVLCNWNRLSEYMRPYTSEGVYFEGRNTCPFYYEGPLTFADPAALATARATLDLGWDWGDVYGFQVGRGALRATLADGVVRFDPGDLAVSEGKLRALPYLRRNERNTGWELASEQAMFVERVRINPRMCARGLQYIAPVLAGIAMADGRFSIELTGCRIPLEDPAAADISGQLMVHDISVGPGVLIREMALLLGSPEMVQIARESVVAFRMTQGRVYHRDLTLLIGGTRITTTGSVGLDQSMALLVTMPVPPRWLGSNARANAALAQQTIQVPIHGTLTRPRLDQAAVEQLSKQFIQRAATDMIQDELRRGLDRLFGQ